MCFFAKSVFVEGVEESIVTWMTFLLYMSVLGSFRISVPCPINTFRNALNNKITIVAASST